jgi:hypothetical protein
LIDLPKKRKRKEEVGADLAGLTLNWIIGSAFHHIESL